VILTPLVFPGLSFERSHVSSYTLVSTSLTYKYKTRVEVNGSGKHSSLAEITTN